MEPAEARRTRPGASILFAGTPAPFPLPDAWRARYHPNWIFEKIETRDMVLDRILPGIAGEIEESVVEGLLGAVALESLEEVLRDDLRAVWRSVSHPVLEDMIQEVAEEALLEELALLFEMRCRAAEDVVLEDLLQDMFEELTAEVWDEETPTDSFVLLSPTEKRHPRLKPLGRVQDHQGFWKSATMTTNSTMFYTTLHATHLT